MTGESPILEVRQLSKRFPGVRALSEVDLNLFAGEVLAVIGENGAGKSTLMKILAGVQTQDEGKVIVDGSEVWIDSVNKALDLGISLIHQELNLSGNLTVGANIFLGREPLKMGLIDETTIIEQSRGYLDMVGLNVDPAVLADDLPIGQQQLVEIAKALSVNSRILIMDEPTSSLSQGEADRLFEVINQLRDNGVSVIYISHRLGEVKALADRVAVLRDGENAGDLSLDEITHDAMVQLMVGRDVSQYYSHSPSYSDEIVLEVDRLRTTAFPAHELTFNIKRGEIVGVSGLVGAGRTEMLQAIFASVPKVSGSVRVLGEEIDGNSTIDVIRAGVALVPEDRKLHGLVIDMSVKENMSLAGLRQNQVGTGFINFDVENDITAEMVDRLKVKTPTQDQIARYLSGGNQQKVVLGKWLSMKPKILLLDEPTRGIDVGAKQEIYQLMEELADQGMSILFVSSELEEIIGMSDRVIVMHEGRLAGELDRSELSEQSIMNLATGGVSQHVTTHR
tara:strand:- start:2536 stop:4059 length:1524 start_codon:yes stop_codon:yes gene_type:complete